MPLYVRHVMRPRWAVVVAVVVTDVVGDVVAVVVSVVREQSSNIESWRNTSSTVLMSSTVCAHEARSATRKFPSAGISRDPAEEKHPTNTLRPWYPVQQTQHIERSVDIPSQSQQHVADDSPICHNMSNIIICGSLV